MNVEYSRGWRAAALLSLWGMIGPVSAAGPATRGPMVGADTSAPTVSITGPGSATTFSATQTVAITAAASDNVGVTRVEFYDGTTLLGTDASPPYSYAWAITGANNGAHRLTARAYDAANNVGTSGAVSVVVDIAVAANRPPTCTIAAPAGNVTIPPGGLVSFAGSGSDPEAGALTYDWSFPNGSPSSSAAQTPGYVTYATAGNYTASLTVRDSQGAACSPVAARTVTVQTLDAATAHQGIAAVTDANGNGFVDSRDVTSICLGCHTTQATNLFHSVHYQWAGVTPNVTDLSGAAIGLAGKDIGAINSYCGTIDSSPWFTCIGCHSGNGGMIDHTIAFDATPPLAQLQNIDCLMCHQDSYTRLGRSDGPDPFQTYGVSGRPDGLTSIEIPYFGQPFVFYPNLEAMGGEPGLLAAVRSVHKTTRTTCLKCHAGAAGSNGGKRGDISSVHASPALPFASDVHMSPAGQNFTCSRCHAAGNHRIKGRGIDLRPTDRNLAGNAIARNTCTDAGCHTTSPHPTSVANAIILNRHPGKVACQTCHIPKFAKDISTEMVRDWTRPEWSATACNGRGGWVPGEVRRQNVIPAYGWFDGTSRIYQLGTKLPPPVWIKAPLDAAARPYDVLAKPNGSIGSATSKIYPMKIHTGLGSRATAGTHSNELVAPSTFTFFTQGATSYDANNPAEILGLPVGYGWNLAVREGMLASWGTNTGFSPVTVNTLEYQTINHGVEPQANALGAASRCGVCHTDRGANMAGGPPRLQLSGPGGLGYDLREPATSTGLCNNCHDGRSNPGLVSVHNVSEHRSRTCSSCHLYR
jgi:PKD repeat protein